MKLNWEGAEKMYSGAVSAEELIRILRLRLHPEGGYFAETYRSGGLIARGNLPARFAGDRPYSTSIYFLLPHSATSRLHRLAADEIWYFHLGGPLTIVELQPDGAVEQIVLGADVRNGQRLQHVVKAGTWFGAFTNPQSKYALVGCAVAPGFDYADFEIGKRQQLIKGFPHAKALIERLTA
jgi:uncharacterized protein